MVHRRRKADPIGAGPPEQREVTMYRPQAQSALLLGAALLAACSDRNTPTARLAGPLAATATLADRPYTLTLTCSGDYRINANRHWTQNGAWVTSDYTDSPGTGQLHVSHI